MATCIKCGTPLKDSEKLCALCGTPVDSSPLSSNQQNSNNNELRNKSKGEQKSMPNCKKCGNPIKENAKFCLRCGTPVNSSSTSSDQQGANNSNSNGTYKKSLDELKSMAKSGDINAALSVGSYYAKNLDFAEADKWLVLTYSGEKINVLGLKMAISIKRLDLSRLIETTHGLSGWTIESFVQKTNEYTRPAKRTVQLWQKDKTIIDKECYSKAMGFLAEVNLYSGIVHLQNTGNMKDSYEKAMRCFNGCIYASFLEPTKKLIANLGYILCDVFLEKSSLSSKAVKAYNGYDYFTKNKGFITRDLDMAEEFVLFALARIINLNIATDVTQSFLPYIRTEYLRTKLLKSHEENRLLRQLELYADVMFRFEQQNDRLDVLKKQRVKSQAVLNEITQLNASNKQLVSIVKPFLDIIPKEYWLAERVAKMRDIVREGYASTLPEALSMLRMEDQAEHERYMDMVMRAESWRRRYGN